MAETAPKTLAVCLPQVVPALAEVVSLLRGMQQLAAQQAPAEQGAALHIPNPVHPQLAKFGVTMS